MRMAGILCVLVLALTPAKMLANEPQILPPADTQLAFVREGQIYLINADGTGLIQLTDTEPGVLNRDPAWSRDGQRLAFASSDIDNDSARGIYIMDADGSNVVKLTDGGYNVEPTWGPDDRTILFSDFLSGSVGLSVIDVDNDGSQGSRVLLDFRGWDAQPAWSPDGQTITFSSDYRAYDIMFDLYAMNADGSEVRPLLQGPFFFVDGPVEYYQSAWSPDGQSIAVVSCPYAFDSCYTILSTIAVANADGSGLREIAQAGSFAKPTWSPDGGWIAFGSASCRDCESSIRFVSVDGSIEGHIVDNGHSPSWRPESGIPINAGHAGAWYSPATSAQGQFLAVDTETQFLFLGWPTYTDEESDTPNEQHWFTAAGHYEGSKAELILYESIGGRFDDPQVVSTTAVGNATLIFSGCDQGRMSYRFDDRDSQGRFSISRAIPGSSNLCESQAEPVTLDMTLNPGLDPGMDGAWVDFNTSGQGFFFDFYADEAGGKSIFAFWLTYGDNTASGHRWLTAQGPFAGSSANLVIYESSGGSFNSPKPAATVAVGSMHINFNDCSHAVLSYSLPGEGIEGTSNLQRAVPGGDIVCEELNAMQ